MMKVEDERKEQNDSNSSLALQQAQQEEVFRTVTSSSVENNTASAFVSSSSSIVFAPAESSDSFVSCYDSSTFFSTTQLQSSSSCMLLSEPERFNCSPISSSPELVQTPIFIPESKSSKLSENDWKELRTLYQQYLTTTTAKSPSQRFPKENRNRLNGSPNVKSRHLKGNRSKPYIVQNISVRRALFELRTNSNSNNGNHSDHRVITVPNHNDSHNDNHNDNHNICPFSSWSSSPSPSPPSSSPALSPVVSCLISSSPSMNHHHHRHNDHSTSSFTTTFTSDAQLELQPSERLACNVPLESVHTIGVSEISSKSLEAPETSEYLKVPLQCVSLKEEDHRTIGRLCLTCQRKLHKDSFVHGFPSCGLQWDSLGPNDPLQTIMPAPYTFAEDPRQPQEEGPTAMILSGPSMSLKDFCDSKVPWFILEQQPFERQRKAYSKENRFLLPNPLVLVANENLARFLYSATVTVRLVGIHGEDLHTLQLRQRQNALLDGTLKATFDSEGRARLALRCLVTSEGRRVRLHFSVHGRLRTSHYESLCVPLYSAPFTVTSNRRSLDLHEPYLEALKPCSAMASEKSEVWIKGSHFLRNIRVYFDAIEATLIEKSDHVITCIAPPRTDLQEPLTVSVTVENINPKEKENRCLSKNFLEYTYLV